MSRSQLSLVGAFVMVGVLMFAVGIFMIGDRRHDIAGALANGMACIGVVYGYGGRGELRAAGAQRIIETPRQIAEILASPLFQDRP